MSYRSTGKEKYLKYGKVESSGKSHGRVRPEKVALGKKLIEDPGFPSDEMIEQVAEKIFNQYFSKKIRESE